MLRTAFMVFVFLLSLTTTSFSQDEPPPPGSCWEYHPTYCYLLAQTCTPANCNFQRTVTSAAYQELIAGARTTTVQGYASKRVIPMSQRCGTLQFCRSIDDGVDEEGNPVIRCEVGANVLNWFAWEVELYGHCIPGGGGPN